MQSTVPAGSTPAAPWIQFVDTIGVRLPRLEAAERVRSAFLRLSGAHLLGFHSWADRHRAVLPRDVGGWLPGRPVCTRLSVGRLSYADLVELLDVLHHEGAWPYRIDVAIDLGPGLDFDFAHLGRPRFGRGHATYYWGRFEDGDDAVAAFYRDRPSRRPELDHAPRTPHFERRMMGSELPTIDLRRLAYINLVDELPDGLLNGRMRPSDIQLAELLDELRERGSEPVSDRDLARDLNWPRSSARDRIKALERLGFLNVIRRRPGRGSASIYAVRDPLYGSLSAHVNWLFS